jgi:hypothetical protein
MCDDCMLLNCYAEAGLIIFPAFLIPLGERHPLGQLGNKILDEGIPNELRRVPR